MEFLRQLKIAARSLSRQPGFAVVAIVTLGLGIGATAAVFAVVDAVLLRPLPFAEPERLVRAWSSNPDRGIARFGVSPLDFLDWRKETRSFEQLVAWSGGNAALAMPGASAEPLNAVSVTEGFFDLVGVQPQLGRPLGAADYAAPRATAIVLSDALWRTRFAGDAGLVGRTVELDGAPRQVVGIMPPGFRFPGAFAAVDVWVPYVFSQDELRSRGARWLSVGGRLRRGATMAAAQAEMAALAARLAAQDPAHNQGWTVAMVALRDAVIGGTRQSLLLLFGAVSLLLLIACCNVASLLAARAFARRGEVALRAALGGSAWRLLSPLAAEGLLLSLAGGGVGMLAARWLRDGLLWLAGGQLPQLQPAAFDAPLLAGAFAVAVVAGLLCSVLPALPVVRGAVFAVRRESPGASATAAIRRVLVVGEVALTLLLLAGAGLMARTLVNLLGQDTGIRPENVLTFQLALPEAAYAEPARRAAFFSEALSRIGGLPGVVAVGATNVLPLSGDDWSISFDRVDRPRPENEQASAEYRVITPGTLSALGVAVRRGRGLQEQDRAGAPLVALVSETFARRFYAGEDPLGKQIKIGDRTPEPRTIVGVVADVREDLAEPAPAMYYVPAAQKPLDGMALAVRFDPRVAGPAAVLSGVRGLVANLDRNLPVSNVATLEQVRRDSLGRRRLSALLLGAFASAALLLAVVGLYGLMSFQVSQRAGEFGVRAALGAGRRDLHGLVLRQGLGLAMVGVLIGGAAALLLGRVLAGLLFGVSANDPLTLAGVAGVLLLAAGGGCWVPARRASRLDPMSVLRGE